MTIKLPEPRKSYTCKSCSHTYLDVCVTSCDCLPERDEFHEENIYTEDQLKQAIRDALEEAATVCEQAKNRYTEGTMYLYFPTMFQFRADEIRKLKEQV